MAQLSALVYGDVDLNLIDGSAIWVQSTVQALARAGCLVTLVVKAPVRTDRLIAPLLAEPGVTVRRPHAEQLISGLGGASLSADQAAQLLAALDRERRHDLVVLRGLRLVSKVVAGGAFAGRLWTYLTDIPQSIAAMTEEKAAELNAIAAASRYLLCQTEELRSFLEGSAPEACGKCVLMPPVVPAPAGPPRRRARTGTDGPLRLVYTGKFAPRWNTYEMTQLPGLLAARGVPAEVHMVGDKIHNDPADPGYARRMRAALGPLRTGPPAEPPAPGGHGVIWYGGRSREAAMELAASCDIGLSWRDASLDASLELSTKVLEFGILGLPVILNRTPMHEELLGADYPLFARDLTEVADAAAEAAADPAVAQLAAARTAAAARSATLESAAQRLRGYLDWAFPPPGGPRRPGGRAAPGRRGGPRPEVLRPHPGVPEGPARAGSAGGPVGEPGQALRRGQHGHGPVGGRRDLRMVRAERDLVQQAQAARLAPDRPAAPVRARRGLREPGQHQGDRPGRVREPALCPAVPRAGWLARRARWSRSRTRWMWPSSTGPSWKVPGITSASSGSCRPQAPGSRPRRARGTPPRG